jgi:hypothetical protein
MRFGLAVHMQRERDCVVSEAKPMINDVVISTDSIQEKIYLVRGNKVMLSHDLASLYDVPTKALIQAVKRNEERFPDDFMFQLSDAEFHSLRSQIVTLENGRGRYPKYRPYAFTEQGVAMLSAVLSSDRAVQVSIGIIRVFVKLRQMALNHEQLSHRIDDLERKYDGRFQMIFEAVRELIGPRPVPPRRRIGFRTSTSPEPNRKRR